MAQPEIAGKLFSVVGGARSGLAVARLLAQHGGRVFVSEKAGGDAVRSMTEALTRQGIPFEVGGNTGRVLEAEVIVLSPGVPSDAPIVLQALERRRSVVSEIEVAGWFCRGRIAGITGTNGKTTTTALVGRILEDAKQPSVVAGNIGVAFSDVVGTIAEDAIAVLEISSFQLDHIDRFRPEVAVILNVTPDHLDRYGNSFERYVASKCRIFRNQRDGDTVIYSGDDEVTRTNVERLVHPSVRKLSFSTRARVAAGAFVENGEMKISMDGELHDIVPTHEISIRGMHNLYNAMAASLVAKAMGVSTASLRATLKNFKGVEHRLEFVRQWHGRTFVNDSKATNVDSVWYALQSFERPIVLLLGGRDKGNDYTRLEPLVRNQVRSIIAIGESAGRVVAAFSGIVPVRKAGSMEEAVRSAAETAVEGDVVLLSPACASFDWFDNYEHRGRAFKDAVMSLG